jgi:hypothetical protein
MGFTKVTLNRPGVGDVLTSSEVQGALLAIATAAAATARSRAPVATGAYRDSIEARIVPGRTQRAAAEVIANVPYATIIESRLRVLGGSL